MKKREFSPEFKQHCCQLVVNDKRAMTDVYKEFELDRQTLHRWVNEYKELGENAFIDKSLVTSAGIIKKLEREKRELEEANEILKKAIAYFTKKKSD
jgi:transposase